MNRFLLLAFACLLVGCSQDQEAEEQNSVDPSSDPPVEENNETEAVNASAENAAFPLSGKISDTDSDQRAISVILNNHPQARPQSGLQEADIVYEVLAEGGITRLLAIYQSQYPERVGPIRSARDYHIQLANGFDSFFVAHGYSPDALAMLEAGVIDHMNGIQYDGELFVRSADRVAPHNSYSGAALIETGAERASTTLKGAPEKMNFLEQDESFEEGQNAGAFTLSYDGNPSYTSSYKYDATTRTYTRSISGEETIDKETNTPIAISNILVLEADHQVVDDQGRLMVDVGSGGNATIFQQGKWVSMTWQDVDGRMVPMQDGTPAELTPGLSWIHIIPAAKGFEEAVTIHD